jgi:RNA polymerase sigma-70 factor (ECF subfamily)
MPDFSHGIHDSVSSGEMTESAENIPRKSRAGIAHSEMMFRQRDPLANPEPLIARVYAYCAYRLGQGPDAEDATSDVFERALRHRASYDPRKGTPLAWLLGIAHRSVSDVARARLPTVEQVPPDAETVPERDLALRLDLAEALARLDLHDRELIALRYGADLKARQIGELLQMRTHAVEMGLHRALGRLRGQLERDEHHAALRELRTVVPP